MTTGCRIGRSCGNPSMWPIPERCHEKTGEKRRTHETLPETTVIAKKKKPENRRVYTPQNGSRGGLPIIHFQLLPSMLVSGSVFVYFEGSRFKTRVGVFFPHPIWGRFDDHFASLTLRNKQKLLKFDVFLFFNRNRCESYFTVQFCSLTFEICLLEKRNQGENGQKSHKFRSSG